MEDTLEIEKPKIGRPIEFSGSTSDSFNEELRDLLWSRTTKALSIGLVVSVLITLVYLILYKHDPLLEASNAGSRRILQVGHPLIFALGLLVLGILRHHACLMKIQLITFLVFAINLVLLTAWQLIKNPDDPGYLGVALLLFVPAAFIPWKTRNQIGLTIVALLSFLAVQVYGMTSVPVFQNFWYSQQGNVSFFSYVIMTAVSIAVLGAVSSVMSHTLYSLSKTKHQARRLGSYIIEDELGRGGMGRVFLAKHALICRPAAVKVMMASEGEAEASLTRFEREVRLSATLTHPNTIQIYDFGRSGQNTFYYAMEYLSGLDLQKLVERFGPLPPERVAFILEQVCGSLMEAHSREIIHRDIKPSNIFLTERGGLHDFAKILDFGLARRLQTEEASSVTKTGMIFGTPRYISPEALYSQEGLDGRSDIYNLGGVAYWLLTGQPPFRTSSSVDLIIDHVKTVPSRPAEISETSIPPELDAAIMKCLEKKADSRFQDAGEFAEVLRAITFPEPWTWQRAKDWWELHGLTEDTVSTCN